MKTTDPLRALRVQVRALWGAVLVFAGVAAAANVRPLHVSNADNTPDTDVSLSSTHWTGTLDAARLPTALTPGSVSTGALSITTSGPFPLSITSGGGFPPSRFMYRGASMLDLFSRQDLGIDLVSAPGEIQAGGDIITAGTVVAGSDGGYIDTSNYGGGVLTANSGGYVATINSGGYVDTSNSGGQIDTSNHGGFLCTNGTGAPTGTGAPVGSLYCDQTGTSGHVLWVRETTGWVGK